VAGGPRVKVHSRRQTRNRDAHYTSKPARARPAHSIARFASASGVVTFTICDELKRFASSHAEVPDARSNDAVAARTSSLLSLAPAKTRVAHRPLAQGPGFKRESQGTSELATSTIVIRLRVFCRLWRRDQRSKLLRRFAQEKTSCSDPTRSPGLQCQLATSS
jgi:hypothetical protein